MREGDGGGCVEGWGGLGIIPVKDDISGDGGSVIVTRLRTFSPP